MLQVLGLVLPLFGIILLGYISGRLKSISIAGLGWLNFFVLYIALPAMIFQLLVKTPVEEFANIWFLAATTAGTFCIFVVSFLLAKFLSKDTLEDATIQGFVGAYGNIGYLAPPLALAAFGPEAAVPVALIFCLDNSLHFTLAPLMMSLSGQSHTTRWALIVGIVRKILTHPFILATLAGILGAVMLWQLPDPLSRFLTLLSQAAAPCALFAMGITAALRPLKRVPTQLSYLLPLKLLLHPLLVYALVSLIPSVPDVWLHSAVLLAALPTATNVFVIAQQYGVWQERASSAVVLSTLVSTVTVTGYLYLVKIGAL